MWPWSERPYSVSTLVGVYPDALKVPRNRSINKYVPVVPTVALDELKDPFYEIEKAKVGEIQVCFQPMISQEEERNTLALVPVNPSSSIEIQATVSKPTIVPQSILYEGHTIVLGEVVSDSIIRAGGIIDLLRNYHLTVEASESIHTTKKLKIDSIRGRVARITAAGEEAELSQAVDVMRTGGLVSLQRIEEQEAQFMQLSANPPISPPRENARGSMSQFEISISPSAIKTDSITGQAKVLLERPTGEYYNGGRNIMDWSKGDYEIGLKMKDERIAFLESQLGFSRPSPGVQLEELPSSSSS